MQQQFFVISVGTGPPRRTFRLSFLKGYLRHSWMVAEFEARSKHSQEAEEQMIQPPGHGWLGNFLTQGSADCHAGIGGVLRSSRRSHLAVSERRTRPQAAHSSNSITALCRLNSGRLAQTTPEFSFPRALLSPQLLFPVSTPIQT